MSEMWNDWNLGTCYAMYWEQERETVFAKDLIETLLKKKPKVVKEDAVILFMKDIMKYVRNNDKEEYKTNQ